MVSSETCRLSLHNAGEPVPQTRELSLTGRNFAAAMTARMRRSVHRREIHRPPAHVGLLAFKNVRKWRTASGIRSFASFQGKNVICAFGASMAVSSATA
jgi:hypothetical protein